MPIDDFTTIDIQTVVDGVPHLKIADVGALEPQTRIECFKKKLLVYKAYIESTEFREQNPNWQSTTITLVSPVGPTDEMNQINAIKIQVDNEETIVPVLFKERKKTLG